MRTEFTNRMDIQRQVLKIVNSLAHSDEELLGLSDGAITRWAKSGRRTQDDSVVCLLRQISDKIAFLATKSQEQISESYKRTISEVPDLVRRLEHELKS